MAEAVVRECFDSVCVQNCSFRLSHVLMIEKVELSGDLYKLYHTPMKHNKIMQLLRNLSAMAHVLRIDSIDESTVFILNVYLIPLLQMMCVCASVIDDPFKLIHVNSIFDFTMININLLSSVYNF